MTQHVRWRGPRRELANLTDQQLTERARGGDNRAFGELFRRHRKAAESTARYLLRSPSDADDVVADAFAGVLAAIRNGYGPRDNFRRYLLASVRNACRSRRPLVLAGDSEREPDSRGSGMFGDPERYVEADTVARAFASLHPRWQQTLWLTEVEQLSAAEVAAQLRLAPNAAAALTRRAREAFATAYLAEHGRAAANAVCTRFASQLAALVRDQLTDAQRVAVEEHIASCVDCAKAADDLRDLNSSLRTLTPAPGALSGIGAATPATLAGTSIGGSSAGLLGGSLLLKGAAALLVVAPVLIADSTGRDDGEGDTMTVEGANAAAEDGAAASVSTTEPVALSTSVSSPVSTAQVVADTIVRPNSRPEAIGAVGAAGAAPSTIGTITSEAAPPTISAAPDRLLEPITALVDGVLSDVVSPLVDGLVYEVVVPLVGDAVTEVVAPVVRLAGGVVDDSVTVVDDVAGSVGLPDTGDAVELVDDLLGAPAASEPSDAAVTAPSPTSPPPSAAPSTSTAASPGQSATTSATAPPASALPPITVPVISVAPITLPLNVPPVTVSPISVPPITVPDLLGG